MAKLRSLFVMVFLISVIGPVITDDCAYLISNATIKSYAVLTGKVETMTDCDEYIAEIKVKRVFKVPKSLGIVRGSEVRVKISGANISISSEEDLLSCFGVFTEPPPPRVKDTKLFFLSTSEEHPISVKSEFENDGVNVPLHFDLLYPALPITLANLDRVSAASKVISITKFTVSQERKAFLLIRNTLKKYDLI